MTDFKIEAKTREVSAQKAKKDGFIPGIVYGNNFEGIKVSVPKIEFLKLFREAGTSNLVELKIDGGKSVKTLIHEIQHHVVNGEIIHIDFFKVNMKEKIHAEIPLSFIGESNAVINLDGTLITSKDSIEVECLPGDLVSEIEVDITVLDEFDKNIKIEDIKAPAGIEILDDAEEIVAYVQEPRSEEELAALDEAVVEDVNAVEVENAGEEASAEATEENK